MFRNAYVEVLNDYSSIEQGTEINLENFQELLENINFSEKINVIHPFFAQWCEDYYWELDQLCQEMFQEYLMASNAIQVSS